MTEPPHEEATVPRKEYLKTAFDTLEEGIKKNLEDLRDKFDQKTKRAIDGLIGKKPDGLPQDILSETQNTLKAFRHHEYHKLTIQEKGSLQRWALAKRVDSNIVEELSNIKAKHQSQEDTEARASNEISMSLDELLLVCGEQKKVAGLKQKVYKFLGKEIKIHSLWANIVDTVNRLKSVGDTAASSNQTAGLVWGIFKVVLQFAVMSEKGAEAAFSGMQTAVNVLQRAATYEKHIYDPAGHQKLIQSATEPFEGCLISTYQRVFKFFVIASKCFTKSRASLCWYVFWSDKDILEFEQDIFKYEQTLFRDAAIKSLIDQGSKASVIHDLVKDMNAHIMGTQESIVDILSQQSGITLLLRSLQSKVHDIQTLMRTNCPDVTRDEMLGWFSAARVEDHHRSAKDKRTMNTAEWVLKKQHYLDWSSDSGPSLLWIQGISGAGKTTIVSRLVDTYNESAESANSFAQPHVAYFTLASAYHPLPERLVNTYRVKSLKSSLSAKLYEEDYENLLTELIPRTTETVLILDALDECVGEDTRASNEIGKVLKTLNRLLDTKLPIKIVVASRYENRIKHSFAGKHTIEISADDNSSDIEKIVVARIDNYNLTDPMVRINKDLEKKILKVFNEKSQGKFQWATLHIDHLLDGLTDGILPGAFAVEETLGELPEGLIDTYSEIFHRINNKLHKRQKETALRVFKWLLAMGTCDEKVLIAAVCQRLQGQPGDYPDRVEGDAGYILTACQHLVTIQDSEFRFSHLSVDEYLRNHQTELVDTCHYDVAKVCTSVLFRYKTGEGAMEPWAYFCQKVKVPLPLRDGQQSFMNELWYFACNQWHVQFQKTLSPSHRKEMETIVDDSFPRAFTTWLSVRVMGLTRLKVSPISAHDHSYLHFPWLEGDPVSREFWVKSLTLLEGPNSGIGYTVLVETAILCGLLNKLHWFIKEDMTHGVSPGYYENRPVDVLIVLNQLFIDMEHSLARRKLANGLSRWGYHAFGQEEFSTLCQVYLKFFEDQTSSRTVQINTMLCQVFLCLRHARNRAITRFESLKVFFSEGPQQGQHADQCYGELARLTLLYVSLTEDKELGDFLFDRFPDASKIQYEHLVPPVGFDLDSVLVKAAARPDKRYISLLLSHGANKNAETAEGTPLMAALSNERIENAEVLLQAGADMDGVILNPTMGYGNITIMACSVQNSGLFQFLRKHDAIDMDSVAETGTCLTPLIAACLHGHSDRVNALLLMGVDFNRRLTSGLYANALCAAADGQSIRAIRQLLRRNLSHPKEDALEIWRRNHLEASAPEYSASISKRCQTLLSWLTFATLQRTHEEASCGGDTGVIGSNEIEGRVDDTDEFLWDGYDDSSNEDESGDDGYDTTNQDEDDRDKGGEQEKEQEQQRLDIESEGGIDSGSPVLLTARRDNDNVAAPSDDEVLKSLNDLLSWLHQDCVQEPQVVQHELAGTFGFPFSEQNDSMAVELVRNALLKGFQNALRLTHKQRTLNDITKTWTRFLDLAEDTMGLIDVFENAFDKGNGAELARLHAQTETLANGGIGQV